MLFISPCNYPKYIFQKSGQTLFHLFLIHGILWDPFLAFLPLFRAVVLKMLSPEQCHQRHLGTCQKCKFSGLRSRPDESEPWAQRQDEPRSAFTKPSLWLRCGLEFAESVLGQMVSWMIKVGPKILSCSSSPEGKKRGGFYGPGQEITPITSSCIHLASPTHMVTQFQEWVRKHSL